jgi:hypothetical protein
MKGYTSSAHRNSLDFIEHRYPTLKVQSETYNYHTMSQPRVTGPNRCRRRVTSPQPPISQPLQPSSSNNCSVPVHSPMAYFANNTTPLANGVPLAG